MDVWLPSLRGVILRLGAGLLFSCWAWAGQAAEPIRVLATMPALHSWAANVAGDDARVETLPAANVGPHDFQFRPSDLRRLGAAHVVVRNGLGVDVWLDKALASNPGPAGRRVVVTSQGLQTEWITRIPEIEISSVPASGKEQSKGRDHDHDHDHDSEPGHGAAGGHGHDGGPNPHLWLDPVFAKHGVSNILEALVAVDPEHAEGYRRRSAAYVMELDRLDAEIRSHVGGLKDRRLVTFHDAFPYFCRRYGLELVGVVEEVPNVEPGPRYLTSLSKAIRRTGVQVVFSEPQFHPRLVRRLAEDLGIRTAELDVLETGVPSAGFYVEGQRRNLRALASALR